MRLILLTAFLFTLALGTNAQLLDSASLEKEKSWKYLDQAIQSPDKVIVLNLKEFKMESLPTAVNRFSNVQKLHLGWNQLTDISPIKNMKDLQILFMNDNRLEQIPSWISDFKNIYSLNISGNKLKTLPVDIPSLKGMKYLDMRFNQFEKLPDWLGDLVELRTLGIGQNPLTELPASIGKLSKLQELDLSYTKIKDYPKEIGNLKSLKSLDIEGVKFGETGKEHRAKLKELKKLLPECDILY